MITRNSPVFCMLAFMLMSSLIGAIPAQGSDTLATDKLKDQIIQIQNQGSLGITDLRLCRHITGYGKYVPYEGSVVERDAVVHFYYETENIFTSVNDGVYAIYYSQDAILENSAGEQLLNMPKALRFDYQSNKPILNIFAQFELDLGGAPPGDYVYKIVLYDELRGTSTSAQLPFTIR